MKDFLRQNGILLVIIALLLTILIGVGTAFMGGNADPLSNVVNTVTSPIRNGIAAAADWAEGVYNYVFRYGQIQEELDSLRAQVAELEDQVRETSACGSCWTSRPNVRTSSLSPRGLLGAPLTTGHPH